MPSEPLSLLAASCWSGMGEAGSASLATIGPDRLPPLAGSSTSSLPSSASLLISVYPAPPSPTPCPPGTALLCRSARSPLSHSRRDRGTSLGTDPKISNDPRDPQLDVSGRAGGRLLIGAGTSDISRWDDSDLTTILEKEGRLF